MVSIGMTNYLTNCTDRETAVGKLSATLKLIYTLPIMPYMMSRQPLQIRPEQLMLSLQNCHAHLLKTPKTLKRTRGLFSVLWLFSDFAKVR